MATEKIKFDLTASDQTAQAFNAILGRLDSVDQSAKKASASFTNLGAGIGSAFAGISAGAVVRQMVGLADTFTNLTSRLGLVVAGTQNLNSVQQDLFAISQQTRNPLEATTDIYTRLARSTQHLGTSQGALLATTSTLSKALIISGGSVQSTSAAMIQLAQGLQSGQLRGQELNSVLEQTPRVAQAIADGLGMTIGQLRSYAEEGKLSADAVIGALIKQKDTIDKEFARMPVTVGQAIQTVNNSIVQFTGNVDKTTNASGSLAKIIKGVADKIDELQTSVKGAEPAIVSTIAAITAFATSGAVIAGLGAIAALVGTISAPILAASAAVAGLVYGLTYLSTKKFANQQSDALKLVEGLDTRAEDARLMRQRNIVPVITEEDKKRAEKLKSFLQDLKDKTNDILYGKDYNVLQKARELGGEKAVATATKELEIIEAMERAKKRSNERNKEYAEINEWVAKTTLQESRERKEQTEREEKAAEKSATYLTKYREDMDIILEQIRIKNDGMYRTAEQQLIENAQLQLKKKLNEQIAIQSKSENLTADEKKKAIEEANAEYARQLKLVKQIAEQRAADQKDLVKGVSTGAGKYFEEVSNMAAFTEDATTRALRGMEDALVSMVQTGKLSFRDLANSIIADLIRIQIRQSITAPLAGLLSGMTASFTPIVSGGSAYSATSADITGRRAQGGNVNSGSSYLVGENGPEIFTPYNSGNITPNNQTGGSAVTVVQNINVTTGVQQTVRAEIMTLMPQIAASAKSAVADAKLRGGSYANALR